MHKFIGCAIPSDSAVHVIIFSVQSLSFFLPLRLNPRGGRQTVVYLVLLPILGLFTIKFNGYEMRSVSRFTETDRNGPKRTFVDTETDSLSTETDSLGTETDRNGPERTETDFRGYRNGLSEYRNGLSGNRNGPERTFVNTETDSVGTES